MKCYLLTICLLAGTTIVSYGQSTMNRSSATATATVGVHVGEAPEQQQSNAQEKLLLSSRINEMDASLSRGRNSRAMDILKEAQDEMVLIMGRNQERMEEANTDAARLQLDRLVVKQKQLYNEIKVLSTDISANQAMLKAKMDEFLNTL